MCAPANAVPISDLIQGLEHQKLSWERGVDWIFQAATVERTVPGYLEALRPAEIAFLANVIDALKRLAAIEDQA
ncbi:MAG: hypothetical protein LBD02_01290 [Christensenellaceae bacterium]|jgi:hypothetical protein|nr:hypothetical protein [Christensenellaceae bacterium]